MAFQYCFHFLLSHSICFDETNYFGKEKRTRFFQRHRLIQISEPYINVIKITQCVTSRLLIELANWQQCTLSCRHWGMSKNTGTISLGVYFYKRRNSLKQASYFYNNKNNGCLKPLNLYSSLWNIYPMLMFFLYL